MTGLSLRQGDDFSASIKCADARFGSGFLAEPILAQALREPGVSLNGDIPRHGSPDPTLVDDVDVLPSELEIRCLFNEDRDTRQNVHTLTPLTRPSRRGAADSATINGAPILTCVKVVNALISLLFSTELAPITVSPASATGRRLAPVGRSYSPLAT